MRLTPLMTFRNALAQVQPIGAGAFGERITYITGEGVFEGERLRGRILPGGGDWLVKGAGGLSRLDVRKTFETDDGALIHVSYQGLYRFDAALSAKLARGEDGAFGETLFTIQAQFDTGDERYGWLNETLAVGEGRETAHGVEYRLFSLSA